MHEDDCITCADGHAVEAVFEDGTGTCGHESHSESHESHHSESHESESDGAAKVLLSFAAVAVAFVAAAF